MKLFAISLFVCFFTSIFGVEWRVEKNPPIKFWKFPLDRRFDKCVESCGPNGGFEECYLVPITETELVASKCVARCYFELGASYQNLETCLCWKNRCVARPLKRKMPDEEEKQPGTGTLTLGRFKLLKEAERRKYL